MPVHTQLCEDREFLTKTVDTESGLGVLQTNSDTSQSDIDFDCSTLLSQSDDNESDHLDHTYRKFHAKNPQPSTSKVPNLDPEPQTANFAPVVHHESMC